MSRVSRGRCLTSLVGFDRGFTGRVNSSGLWFVLVGLITGILYGVIAQASDFCIRRGIADFAEGKDSLVLQDGL